MRSFFGVYLLLCQNEKYRGRIYIGFTTDPDRRLKQHNLGAKFGGAYKTSNRGPWEMVLLIHGFPNNLSALQFEWAWQNPLKSRRVRNIANKRSKESQISYRIRILWELLQVGPWYRLPLIVQWLNDTYRSEYPSTKCPPLHISIVTFEFEKSTSIASNDYKSSTVDNSYCMLCFQKFTNGDLLTICPIRCPEAIHLRCLARHFLFLSSPDEYVPIEGSCLVCKRSFLWVKFVDNSFVFGG